MQCSLFTEVDRSLIVALLAYCRRRHLTSQCTVEEQRFIIILLSFCHAYNPRRLVFEANRIRIDSARFRRGLRRDVNHCGNRRGDRCVRHRSQHR